MSRKIIGLLAEPVNLFELGPSLVEAKRLINEKCIEKALADGKNVTTAARNAATLFYTMTQQTRGYSPKTTAMYIRVYERFADSTLRAKLEGIFGPSELLALVPFTDDDLVDIVSAKEANPGMTRDQLKEMLKARSLRTG